MADPLRCCQLSWTSLYNTVGLRYCVARVCKRQWRLEIILDCIGWHCQFVCDDIVLDCIRWHCVGLYVMTLYWIVSDDIMSVRGCSDISHHDVDAMSCRRHSLHWEKETHRKRQCDDCLQRQRRRVPHGYHQGTALSTTWLLLTYSIEYHMATPSRYSMQGWVELCYVKADWLEIEPATCKSQVQCPTAAPRRSTLHYFIKFSDFAFKTILILFILGITLYEHWATVNRNGCHGFVSWVNCQYYYVLIKQLNCYFCSSVGI